MWLVNVWRRVRVAACPWSLLSNRQNALPRLERLNVHSAYMSS